MAVFVLTQIYKYSGDQILDSQDEPETTVFNDANTMKCHRRRALILSGNTPFKCGTIFQNLSTDNFDINY